MSDLKLFRLIDGTATELTSASLALEKSLQTLVERNMDALLGVRFLASEYSTGELELRIANGEQLEKALPLVQKSNEAS